MKEKQEVVKQSVNIGSTLGNSTAMASGKHIERTEDNIFHIQFESRSNRTTAEGKSVKNIFLSFFHSPEELTWNRTQSLPALIYRVDSPDKSC